MLFLYRISMFMCVLSIVLGVTLSVAAIAAGMWYLVPVAVFCFGTISWMIWDMWSL